LLIKTSKTYIRTVRGRISAWQAMQKGVLMAQFLFCLQDIALGMAGLTNGIPAGLFTIKESTYFLFSPLPAKEEEIISLKNWN